MKRKLVTYSVNILLNGGYKEEINNYFVLTNTKANFKQTGDYDED